MRVNELVYRTDENTLLQIRDLAHDIELNGLRKDITEDEEFKKLKLGNLLVTHICTRVDTSKPILRPVIVVMAEK